MRSTTEFTAETTALENKAVNLRTRAEELNAAGSLTATQFLQLAEQAELEYIEHRVKHRDVSQKWHGAEIIKRMKAQ
jgi:hypothetical protein